MKRKDDIAKRCGLDVKEVDAFVAEFVSMKKMMMRNLKGMDMDVMEQDPNAPMQTMAAKAAQAKKDKKMKPTRGGGAGFGVAK